MRTSRKTYLIQLIQTNLSIAGFTNDQIIEGTAKYRRKTVAELVKISKEAEDVAAKVRARKAQYDLNELAEFYGVEDASTLSVIEPKIDLSYTDDYIEILTY
jgi:hypothetical protein